MNTRVQRVAAYGLARRDDQVLLVRIAGTLPQEVGNWMLPGGGVAHGEHPEAAVVRELREETGLDVAVDRLLDVGSDHRPLPFTTGTVDFHCVYFVYAVTAIGGRLRAEPDGTTHTPSWVAAPRVPELPLLPAMAPMLLGLLGKSPPAGQ